MSSIVIVTALIHPKSKHQCMKIQCGLSQYHKAQAAIVNKPIPGVDIFFLAILLYRTRCADLSLSFCLANRVGPLVPLSHSSRPPASPQRFYKKKEHSLSWIQHRKKSVKFVMHSIYKNLSDVISHHNLTTEKLEQVRRNTWSRRESEHLSSSLLSGQWLKTIESQRNTKHAN